MSAHTRLIRLPIRYLIGILAISLLGTFVWRGAAASAGGSDLQSGDAQQKRQDMAQALSRFPMSFEENQGQADTEVKFISRGRGYQVFLTGREAALVLQTRGDGNGAPIGGAARSLWEEPQQRTLRFSPSAASNRGGVEGVDLLRTKTNYLIGNDPAKWKTGVPNYARVLYKAVYPGVDLAFYGSQTSLEYDFIVSPGADLSTITMKVEGADRIDLEANGDLVLSVGGAKLYTRSPLSYQRRNGERQVVASRYVLKGRDQIGFAVEAYDRSKPLVIDPVIDFSTFLGGAGSDEGFAVAVDSAGAAYVTGSTYSNNFNTAGALQTINRGGKYDAFVTKINPAGSAIVYSTYLGGGGEDSGRGVAVNTGGNAFVAGITNSPDFNTRNPLQATITGAAEDAFLAKLSADGASVLFSTYFGGANIDQAFGVALDAAGDAYLTGSTVSTDFPIKNAFQTTNRGGSGDAFIAKIQGDGAQTLYASYLGGGGFDEAYGVALDAAGNAYICGQTASTDFNLTNPLQPVNAGGGSDGFFAKIDATGTALHYASYLGGGGVDIATGVDVDANNNAYVTGHTFSTDYPLQNPLQSSNAGGADVFISRINVFGQGFIYSTYLGGSGGDFARGVAVDANSQAYLVGRTASTDFKINNALQSTLRGNQDAFVAKVNLTGSGLIFSTYLGGGGDDLGNGIALDDAGSAYVTGDTRSSDFNTKNPLQAVNRGGLDAFISKLDPAGAALVYSTYLGGSGEDLAQGVALDASGNAYLTGYTTSNDFNTKSPIQPYSRGGVEAFVTKIFADASDIAFNTFFGGNGSDVGNAIAVDGNSNCYVTGGTTSSNFATRTPIQPNNGGGLDAFVAKFDPAGANLLYSTYLGGGFGDQGRGVVVDQTGSAFIAGSTFSENFPTVSPFQTSNRGQGDAFVARLTPAGTSLSYSSYLGGTGGDEAAGIALDAAGNAFVVGNTASTDFNTKSPLQAASGGGQDAFVAKVDSNGSALLYSTYLGGNRTDLGNAIAVDPAGNAVITGATASLNFPVQGAFQTAYGGGDLDAFVAKLNPAGAALVFSTYLGGSLADVGNGVAIDGLGNCYIAGVTGSPDFPAQSAIQAENRGGTDAFLAKVPTSGASLLFSTYLGGSGDDGAYAVAVDSSGTVLMTGGTASSNFNTVAPLLSYGGGTDIFVAKIASETTLTLSPPTLDVQIATPGVMSVGLGQSRSTDVTVELTSSNTAIATVPTSVVIPADSLTSDFMVTGVAVGGPVTITAKLTLPQGDVIATSKVTVVFSNRMLRVQSKNAAVGGQLSLPIELISQGDENRLSFSLALDPAVLLNPQFALGSDSGGGTLTVNRSQEGQGRFGVSIQLPGEQVYQAGLRQIVVLSANVVAEPSVTTTPVAFADAPTVRRILDKAGEPLLVVYSSGVVTLSQGFEGDVAPRPAGNNGGLTIADWVQAGRFAVGLDVPATGGEFQRADTAPRANFGDGRISIADWVQTGRYAGGIDLPVPAAGPTSPAATSAQLVGCNPQAVNCQPFSLQRDVQVFQARYSSYFAQQTRAVRLVPTAAQRGGEVTVGVELDAQGSENAVGFSLGYNPAELGYVGVALGADAGTGVVNVNETQASSGRIGLALALPFGQSFPAGTKKILTLRFSIPSGGTLDSIPIAVGDAPVRKELVSANADTLDASFTGGSIVVARPLSNVSAASFKGEALAAEQIVAAFGSGLATETASAASTPLPTTLAGTTVEVRDSLGVARLAPLFYVSAAQINYQTPAGTANGPATVSVKSGDGVLSFGTVTIATVAPSLFTASSTGSGVAASLALRVKADNSQSFEPIAQFDAATNKFVSVPIDLGPEGERVFLIAYGTGFRGASGLGAVSVKIGDVQAQVPFLGPQGALVGLDQANVLIPRSLAGRGEVDVVFTVDGKAANTVKVAVK
jgi:uncharacterized protein (TIGR03437 family)